jgi:DNA-binding Xre family transcriptional regulator
MAREIGYRWHLRRLMADRDMYATTDLRPLLAERGVALSREQVYRLVTQTPERLSLVTLAALCDILGCQPGDLVEPVAAAGKPRPCGSRGRCRARAGRGCCPARDRSAGPGGPLPGRPRHAGRRTSRLCAVLP